ncbi:hypothetical protein GCM10010466_16760 [Planomonospora alba]|uniref:Helix-turn-helix domain-containing protein n=1 Tax=Planomonospora alba TaxID=161354 RepID=A0ABP6MUG3_9ACTN
MATTSDQAIQREELRARAVALRAAGRTRAQIKEALGLAGDWTINELLAGAVPAGSPLRANAKDDLRLRARELRARGWTYQEIEQELGVSRSSVSLWVRDLPRAGRLSWEEARRRTAEGVERYWEREREIRRAARQEISDAAAAAEVGRLTDREILIAGAVAYWCEGYKNKPRRESNHVTFINSDPGLIRLFLRFLEVAGVSRDRLCFRVHIHESADVEAAERFWLDLTGADPGQFRRTTLKRHNARTVRHNTGADYRGCLRIDVLKSMETYRRIEGWAAGVVRGSLLPAGEDGRPVPVPVVRRSGRSWRISISGGAPSPVK